MGSLGWPSRAHLFCGPDPVRGWAEMPPLPPQLYPRICFELYRGFVPQDYGAQEHLDMIFGHYRFAWPFHQKGMRAQSARWFQLFAKEEHNILCWSVQQMILLYIGLNQG